MSGIPPGKKRKLGNSGYCSDFNSVAGCQNKATAGGCVKDGREFKHGCSMSSDGKFCNDSSHNRHTHQ